MNIAGLYGHAAGELDGECVQCGFPAECPGSAFASFEDQAVAVDMTAGDIPDPEVKQLDRGVVVREVTAVLRDLPQLEVHRLDSISGIDYLSYGGVELEERDELVPRPFPGRDHPRGLLPELAAHVLQGGLRGQLAHRRVNRAHERSGPLPVLPGNV